MSIAGAFFHWTLQVTIPHPSLDIERLNNLAVTKPAILTELGILRPVISFPAPTGINLRKISTGQASLFDNNSLRLELWTTASFDFNVKEWAHNIVLDHRGEGEIDGIKVSLTGDVVTLRSTTDTLRLPPMTQTYSGGAALASHVVGNTRFSVRPNRTKWTTGPMVWL